MVAPAMKRGVHADVIAALVAGRFNPVVLFEADWPSGYVRAHTGVGDIVISGNTYSGVGKFGEVSIPAEEFGLVASEASVQVIGPIEDILDANAEAIRNRSARTLWGITTERAGNVLIGDALDMFVGTMDATRVVVSNDGDAKTYGLNLTIGSGPSARTGATITHSGEAQAEEFPGDTGLRHAQLALAKALSDTWPA